MPEIEFHQLSTAGSDRAPNQDAVGSWPLRGGLVFAVADGIGTEGIGQLASTHALKVLARELHAARSDWPVLKCLRRGVQAANLELYEKGITVPDLRRMGTTLTATAVVGTSLVAAHVGDCRLWLLRDGRLTQLTKDHTWARPQRPAGPSEETPIHARRYTLPRCLGQELIVSIDFLSMDLRPGDVLAQSSDGIHARLEEGEIKALLESHPAEAACRELVRRAKERDGQDDASVQVAVVGRLPDPGGRRWWGLER
jgi:PPM family protein phosphatase